MAMVTSETRIDARPEKVWEALADLGGIHKWNPGVTNSYTTSEAAGGENATRHCDLPGNNRLEERAFDWREGEGYKIEVFESTLPLARNIVSFEVTPDRDGTRVQVTADYKLKYGPIGALMDVLVARRQAQQGFDDMMAGLKYHVETGEIVGDEVPAAVPAG